MRSLSLLLVLALPLVASAAEKFALSDGDRVVFLGNTLIEREQLSGWWELALTTHFPGKKITFRNLGWSGDDVFGTAQGSFGGVREGFKHRTEHTLALKPTVIILGYGNVEAFAGEAGKEKFRRGLEALLDSVAPSKARVVLLSPVAYAKLGKPLPDPTRQNANIRLYADVIREVAARRKHRYVDLYDLITEASAGETADPKITHNGIHLTDLGYRRTADKFVHRLGVQAGATVFAAGRGDTVTWKSNRLAVDPIVFKLVNLPAGSYTLYADGKAVKTADAAVWAKGVSLRVPAEAAQVEKLRKLIVAKNELYFHRWRPQNVTYLTGFRKHEQGRNAREIPQFDPLIEAKEQEIAALSVPKITLELKPTKTK